MKNRRGKVKREKESNRKGITINKENKTCWPEKKKKRKKFIEI